MKSRKEYFKKLRYANLDHYRQREQNYREKNREKIRKNDNRYNDILRKKIFGHYSNGKNCCACCGESQFEFLTLDHVNEDGAKKRGKTRQGGVIYYRKLVRENYPDGYQILCYNCNCSRSLRSKNGICPHQKLIKQLLGSGEDIRG